MINKSDQYPVLEDLEHSWSVLTADYNGQYPDLVSRKIGHRDTPLSAFRNYIDSGFYPPPEVLLALDDCFRMYMALSGQLELEDIFYGERKRGVGNFSARKSRIKAYESMLFEDAINGLEKKKTSINKLAEGVLERMRLPDDLDTFLRGYRRYKKKMYKIKILDK